MLNPGNLTRETVFLHRAKVSSLSRVHPDIAIERPGEPTNHKHAYELFNTHDVVLYLNGREALGSVSLILTPGRIRDSSRWVGRYIAHDGARALTRP